MVAMHMAEKAGQWQRPFGALAKVINYDVLDERFSLHGVILTLDAGEF